MIKELRINRMLIYELNKQYFAKYNEMTQLKKIMAIQLNLKEVELYLES